MYFVYYVYVNVFYLDSKKRVQCNENHPTFFTLFLEYTPVVSDIYHHRKWKKNAATKRNVPSHFFFRDQYNAHSLRPLRHRYRVGPAIFSGTIEEQAHDSGCSTTPGHLPACRPTDLILARASTKLYVAHGNIIINSDNYRY